MTVIDLSTLDGTNGVRLNGLNNGDHSGFSVSGAGDLNGDGFADVIIGSRYADPNGYNKAGQSYVVFGKASGFTAGIDFGALDGADGFRLAGLKSGDRSGHSVSGAGDVNGDGIADLIIGALYADPGGQSGGGYSYVVFGKTSGFTADVDLGALDGTNGFRLDGASPNDNSGRSVSDAGDVNGDGFADLIVGAPNADPNGANTAGESFVVFGKASGFTAAMDLASLDGSNGFRLDGIDASDYSGYSVSGAGDVNGDGFDDLFVGARGGDPNGVSFSGESYVVFGRASGFTAGLSFASLDGTDGFRIDGVNANDKTGRTVSDAGDINGDGFYDLIIATQYADPNGVYNAGQSFVVFGKASGFTASVDLGGLDGADGFRLDGLDSGDISGQSASGAGDVNGDGFDDIIIGAVRGDLGAINSGESYVVFGKASGFTASADLAALDGANGFQLAGASGKDYSGSSVSGAGDVNGDGFDDLMVSAISADPNGVRNAGATYIVFGFDSGAVTHQGTSASETLTGSDAANVIIGGLGADTLIGAGGLDVLRGGGGDDIFDVADLGFQRIDGGTGLDTLRISSAALSFDLTAAGSQFVTSIEAIDLAGTGTSATLDRASAAKLSEASNNITVSGDASTQLTLVSTGDAGWTLTNASAAAHTFANGAVTIVMDSAIGRVVTGSAADDLLLGSIGDDILTGGGGLDTIDYSGAAGVVSVNMMTGAVQDGDGGSDTISSIENVIGSDFDDVLIGDGATNTLTGGIGDDILTGGAGVDTIVYAGAAGFVSINLTTGAVQDGDGGTDTISSIENVIGSGFNDVLVGDSGANILTGGAGNDTLTGGDGIDTIVYSGAAGSASINLTTGAAQDGDGGTDTLSSIENVIGSNFNNVLIGDGLANILTGGDGIDELTGGAGDDILIGGAGNDTLTGGDDIDIVDYSKAAGLVSVNMASGAIQDGDGGFDTLSSIENVIGSGFDDVMIGDDAANTFSGGDGDDRLDGRAGDDRLEGGAGNDIYTVEDSGDVVVEEVGEGTQDRINVFVDYTNAANVEFLVGKFSGIGLVLTGNSGDDNITGANQISSPDTINGQGGNDRIVGLVGNDILNGGAGDDIIFGNSGLDVIDGGAGNDVVTGQQNADTFVFGLAAGSDTITDFNGAEDLIDLSAHGFADFAAVQAATTDVSESAVIDLGSGNNITLLGVLEASLASDDFILV